MLRGGTPFPAQLLLRGVTGGAVALIAISPRTGSRRMRPSAPRTWRGSPRSSRTRCAIR